MSDFGFQSWDAGGVPNNYGIKPVNIVAQINLSEGQKSGSYSLPSLAAGTRYGFFVSHEGSSFTSSRRTITISGSTMTIGGASDGAISANAYPATVSVVSVFVESV